MKAIEDRKPRVFYWYQPDTKDVHFDWPSVLRKLRLPQNVAVGDLPVKGPEFGNAKHIRQFATANAAVQKVMSLAFSKYRGDIDFFPLDKKPEKGRSLTQMEMELP